MMTRWGSKLRERVRALEERAATLEKEKHDAEAELHQCREALRGYAERELTALEELKATKARVALWDSQIQHLKFQLVQLQAHVRSKVGDTVTEELWDDIWQVLHPGSANSWEYTAQVVREVRDVVGQLRRELAEERTSAELRGKELAAIVGPAQEYVQEYGIGKMGERATLAVIADARRLRAEVADIEAAENET